MSNGNVNINKKPFCQFRSSPQQRENDFGLTFCDSNISSHSTNWTCKTFLWILFTNSHLPWITFRFIMLFFQSWFSYRRSRWFSQTSEPSVWLIRVHRSLPKCRTSHDATREQTQIRVIHVRSPRMLREGMTVVTPRAAIALPSRCVKRRNGSQRHVHTMSQSLRFTSPKTTCRFASCRQMATWLTHTPTSR